MSSQDGATIRPTDDGARLRVVGGAERFAWTGTSSSTSSNSRVEARAGRSDAGAWSESLGVTVYGEQNWTLPGFGDASPRCGEFYPSGVCTECGEPEFGSHRCGRRGCPDCWTGWAQEAAISATVRLQAFRHTQPDDWHRQLAHATVSPPEGAIYSTDSFKRVWKQAYKLAHEKGFRGTVCIPHPWRLTEEAHRLYRVEMGEEPPYGKWVWLRRKHPDEWRDLVHWSPHFHIIGSTTTDMEPGDGADGWVYRFIRSFSRFDGPRDREAHNDVYGAIRYLISHVGFPQGERFDSRRWTGCLSTSSFTEAEQPSEGVMSVIKRVTEEIADYSLGEDANADADAEDDDDDDDAREPCGECGGEVIDVFDVPMYIDQAEPPPDVSARMRLAWEWRRGDVMPPPGARSPRSWDDAVDAWRVLCERRL